ncbi:MAG: Do family serine endopeptidase [Saprospiraceae bacterium]|nr:Do family serine endopeptidase [Saprospiraceae bacterium]
MKRVAPVLIASLLSAFLAVMIYQKVHTPDTIVVRETLPVSYVSDRNNNLSPASASPVPTVAPTSFIAAANEARRAVVSIQARSSGSFWRNDNFGSSTGSGVIISTDGYIATNNHVVEEGSDIRVILNDQREYKARIVGKDPATDLALLKIEADGLPSVPFGNSDSVFVGEWVLAIGNPFRLQSTVTAGIVSAKGRNISILDQSGIESFIQTDAAVNPGNSGGALVNTRGELIGINTAIITYSGQYEGFSFAVPSNLARKVLFDLRDYGTVQRGWLGISIRSVDAEIADALELKKVAGVYLDAVNAESAAEAAGLRSGDVILEVDGRPTNGTPEFMEFVGQLRPGDRVEIAYLRNGTRRTTTVILSDRRNARARYTDLDDTQVLEDLGLTVRELTSEEKRENRTEGVYVERIRRGSTIAETNMKEGYIITQLNGRSVTSIDELVRGINRQEGLIVLDGFYEDYNGEYPYAFRKD